MNATAILLDDWTHKYFIWWNSWSNKFHLNCGKLPKELPNSYQKFIWFFSIFVFTNVEFLENFFVWRVARHIETFEHMQEFGQTINRCLDHASGTSDSFFIFNKLYGSTNLTVWFIYLSSLKCTTDNHTNKTCIYFVHPNIILISIKN